MSCCFCQRTPLGFPSGQSVHVDFEKVLRYVNTTTTYERLTTERSVDIPRCGACEALAKRTSRISFVCGIVIGLLMCLAIIIRFRLAAEDALLLVPLWLVSAAILWKILFHLLNLRVWLRVRIDPQVIAYLNEGFQLTRINQGVFVWPPWRSP
jgi:hypothetical protein